MSQTFHIAFVSNSETSVKKIIDYLEEKKYKVSLVNTEDALYHLLNNEPVNLVVIELDFNFKDGITLTSDIRNLKNIEQPFIILFSNKMDDYIQITAFNSGADDFIISPIKPILLEARISSIKKRLIYKNDEDLDKNTHSNFYVDKEQYLIITPKGKISLPRKEFEMVNLMYQNAHKIFTRQDFAKLVWNSPEVANSRTIDIHIRNIRRTLGNDIIKTTKGVGYTINRDLL